MRIDSAEFVVGAVGESGAPTDGLPEVAIAGRSNVGKSALINRLVQRRKLAHTSSTPGRTQQLNYYRVNQRLYLVDLPGYGYVRGGVDLRRALGKITEAYVAGRQALRALLLLIDARHGPSELDLAMVRRLRQEPRPLLLVLTKADKLSRGQLGRQIAQLEAGGDLVDLDYLPFSAVSGEGRDELWEWILDAACGDREGMERG